ncbi:carboxylesterase family protein [Actinomadura fulvescens]|uniref:Carboxylic ester hydrolase n=1 Tax=Actinomadura fulvescens TaxID=46160 RepID=A0ABN3Q8B8_9ACTN
MSLVRSRVRVAVAAGLVTVATSAVTIQNAAAQPTQSAVGVGRSGSPVVATDAGVVRGATDATTDRFQGIPYAAPPTGRHRWTPPRPVARWNGIRPATDLAPRCVQVSKAPTSEDCLYLNVYTPKGAAHRGKRLPVMVYIHGGALTSGTGGAYDPTKLVERGTVVVTINYRLGMLGFLAHPALAARDGSAGNYGLMDQQAALRWVQRNIGRFGGERGNVTVFGESAGGLSVLAQLASPGAAGLFSAAINQSGAYNLSLQTLADAKAEGEAYGAAVGCTAQTAGCLRSLSPAALLARQKAILFLQTDGKILPRSLDRAFRSGAFHRVPVVNGTTHDESTYFVATNYDLAGRRVTSDNYLDGIRQMASLSEDDAKRVADRYPLTDYPDPASALAAVATDASFACPALRLDAWLARRVPTYAYEFNDRNAPQLYLGKVSFPYGASHASELQYLFDVRNAVYPAPLSDEQQVLAATMRRHWAAFAKTHRPAPGQWPAYTATRRQMMSYATPSTTLTSGFAADHKCGLWASLQ